MKAKKIATIVLGIVAFLIAAACLAWQLVGHALREFAKGGVC